MIQNYDKPGVVGLLGAALGEKDINIARLYLSRQKDSKKQDYALDFDLDELYRFWRDKN